MDLFGDGLPRSSSDIELQATGVEVRGAKLAGEGYPSGSTLPVVADELVRPEGANFQFLAAPIGDTPVAVARPLLGTAVDGDGNGNGVA